MTTTWIAIENDINDDEIQGMDDEFFGIISRKTFEECGDDEDELVVNGWNDDGSDAWIEE